MIDRSDGALASFANSYCVQLIESEKEHVALEPVVQQARRNGMSPPHDA